MKVVYVIDSLAGGGAERSLVEMVPHLVSGGVELVIALLHDRPGWADEARHGGARVVVVGGRNRGSKLRALRRVMATERPALVHTTLFEADVLGRIAARSLSVPVTGSLVSVDHVPESRQPGVARWKEVAVQLLDAATARLTPRLHAVSGDVAEQMSRRLRYPRDRIEVIHRGRDPDRLGRRTEARRAEARAALDISDDERLVLAVGRHEHAKGLDQILAAMPELRRTYPDVVLRIAGKAGRETASLRELADKVGLDPDEVFLGERQDVAELLCAADLFVLPSRREGMPGVVLEAMALETPILTSDLPVAYELTGRRGVSDDWARQLSAALTEPPDPYLRTRFEASFQIAASAARLAAFWAAASKPAGR